MKYRCGCICEISFSEDSAELASADGLENLEFFSNGCIRSYKSWTKGPIFGPCLSTSMLFSDDPEWF